MATTWYLRGTSAETCADGSTGFDSNTTQGADTTVTSGNENTGSWVELLTFDVTVGAAGPTSNAMDVSVLVGTANGDVDWRYRLQRLSSGCAAQESTGYSGTQRNAGTLTATLDCSSFSWSAGDVLRLSIELQRVAGQHGNKNITATVSSTSSYITDPTVIPTAVGLSSETDSAISVTAATAGGTGMAFASSAAFNGGAIMKGRTIQ